MIMKLTETIKRIREIMELPTYQEDPYQKFIRIYPNGEGSDPGDELELETETEIPVKDTIPNEPSKDLSHMEKSENVMDMMKTIKSGGKLPPILVIQHPLDETKYLVVDGNHRRHVYMKSRSKMIPAIIVPYDKVLLMEKPWNSDNNKGFPLDDIDDEIKLNLYFVKPDGTNNFDKE